MARGGVLPGPSKADLAVVDERDPGESRLRFAELTDVATVSEYALLVSTLTG